MPNDRRRAATAGIDLGRARVLTTALPPGLVDAPKPSKYRNVRTTYEGVIYQSKAEALWASMLDLNVRMGYVRLWVPQPRFRLGCPENVYVSDFLVCHADGGVTADDVKGKRTAKFARDVRLWKRYGRCPLRIITRAEVVEIIEPAGPAGSMP